MNKLMKLAVLGAVAFTFCATQVFARESEDDSSAESPRGNGKKGRKKSGNPTITRMYVAIDKFDNKAGVDANQFSTIRSRIQQAIAGTRKFEVLEREQLKNTLSEQTLMAAGMTDDKDGNAPEAGNMKTAGYVIYGNILFYGQDLSQAVAGGAGSASMRTKVELQVKIASAETGKIIAEKSVIGVGQESRLDLPGSRTSGNIQEQCERAAVAQAAHLVVDALRDVCYPAKIVKVGKRNVMINMTDEEVAEDELFDVIESGEEIFDPDTGASLGSEGEEIGRIRITRTGPKTSVAVPADDDLDLKDIEVGYFVRRVSEATLRREKSKAKKRRNNSFEARF